VNGLRLTLGWVASAVGGRITGGDPEREIGNVSTDTRSLQPGDFFVALQGERFDAHDFVGEAVEKGVGGIVVRRAGLVLQTRQMIETRKNVGVIEVADTTRALQDLARAVRRESGTRVIAITGSAGKTTTKETIAAFLSGRFNVVKNRGNLNNHIGLPLSLMQLRDKPDVAVMELGMNHAGELSTLVGIAEPEVRVWTNVGDAHMGFFASADAIADAKAEILERAASDHLLVCNADDARVMARVTRFSGRTITFGTTPDANVRAEAIDDLGVQGMRARLVTGSGEATMSTPLLGRGNLLNVLAATAVALDAGVPLREIVATASRLTPAERRGAVRRLRGGIVLIDDSYNASPAALRTALDVVARDSHASRKVAVLGEMLELGEHSLGLHRESGRVAAASGLSLLFAIGAAPARALADEAVAAGMPPGVVHYFDRSETAAPRVAAEIRTGDLVLVKGSRGTRTDIVADRIAAEFA
jgi:UDP-N-acetylmuramoyl-tripeptide--D-alanyl-D-alanine ligase